MLVTPAPNHNILAVHGAAEQSQVQVPPAQEDDRNISPESLLQGGSFRQSRVKSYWQLANAAYNAESSSHVSQDRHLWKVILDHRPTNTRIIGKKLPSGAVEIAFRGTVSEDATGERSSANWHSNLNSEIVMLSRDLAGTEEEVQVHGGFQDAYEAVQSELVAWVDERKGGPEKPPLHLAGHSLGGALATLAAVHLQGKLGYTVKAVVTFGSPRVGMHCQLPAALREPGSAEPDRPLLQSKRCGSSGAPGKVLRLRARRAGPSFRRARVAGKMCGNPESYLNTLHAAIEVKVSKAGRVGGLLTWAGAAETDAKTVVGRATQEVKAEVALVRQDMVTLAEGMRKAERRLMDTIRNVQIWEWLTESGTVSSILQDFWTQLPPYDIQSTWVWEISKASDKMYAAAMAELQDAASPLAFQFVAMFVHLNLLKIKAMEASGAGPDEVRKKSTDFVNKCQGFLNSRSIAGWLKDDAESVAALLRSLAQHCDGALCKLPSGWAVAAAVLARRDWEEPGEVVKLGQMAQETLSLRSDTSPAVSQPPEYENLPNWISQASEAIDEMFRKAEAESLSSLHFARFTHLSLLMIKAMQACESEAKEVEEKRRDFVNKCQVFLTRRSLTRWFEDNPDGVVSLLRTLAQHCDGALRTLPSEWASFVDVLQKRNWENAGEVVELVQMAQLKEEFEHPTYGAGGEHTQRTVQILDISRGGSGRAESCPGRYRRQLRSPLTPTHRLRSVQWRQLRPGSA